MIVRDATANKLLLHGARGEKMVNHFTFYAAFPDSQEYRLRHAGKELGTLPLPYTSARDDVITFTGRRWRIEDIDHEKRQVEMAVSGLGKLPRTGGNGMPVHQRVRQQMRKILAESGQPAWLDAAAKSLLRDAQRQYLELNLSAQSYAVEGTTVYLFLWESDQVQKAVVALLIGQGLTAQNFGMGVQVTHTTLALVIEALTRIAAQPCPLPEKIIQRKHVEGAEKWDWVLPDDLFLSSYASRALALEEAHTLCCEIKLQKLESLR